MIAVPDEYWSRNVDDVLASLSTTRSGLSSTEAARRHDEVGPNELHRRGASTRAAVLWRQVKSPLVLLLVFAAAASLVSGEWADAAIVGAILLASVGVGYRREYHAEAAIALLLRRIELATSVCRDGAWCDVPVTTIVPGDVVRLSAGIIVPGDAVLVEATELYVDEAMLTGESFPAAKHVGPSARTTAIAGRDGCVHFGTNVRSGSATAVVVATGGRTAFGAIAGKLALAPPETEFERGLRRFGGLLLVSMLVMIVVVFAINMMLGRPVVETLLFSIALAVGLSPELLPAILGINLSHAARQLAETGLLCRRLTAIENLGSMTILCTDKTGTLTEGAARVDGAYDEAGADSDAVMELAVLNASLQTGLANPIDAALGQIERILPAVRKLGEAPYDFMRKRLSVMFARDGVPTIVTKGAVEHVLEICALDDARRARIHARYEAWCSDGVRVIAVATRRLDAKTSYGSDDEHDLEFAGFITFVDRPKADAARAIRDLGSLGVTVKMITGDSRLVACHVAKAVDLDASRVLTGSEVDDLSDIALVHAAEAASLFVEVDPNHKERILRALRRGGNVVGFFGDGVNDAPAMHAADVSITVDDAVDVAKATADLLLTSKSLDVIRAGIEHGRRTFANTLKYILATTSANLGNMATIAIASLVLPFLPLTAGQVLLNNFLSDIPAFGVATDAVDPELVAKPRRWNMRFIARFMVQFGLLSSLFDAAMFAILLVGFRVGQTGFRTGWFVESLFTELAISLVVRTRRHAWQSAPGRVLVWSTVAIAILGFAIPYLPIAGWLGFAPMPLGMMLAVIAVTVAYVAAAELLKTGRATLARRATEHAIGARIAA